MAARYWTAAMTMPDEEQRAAHHIEKSGFKFYLPIARFPDQTGKLRVRRVLFPRYIFILMKAGWERLLCAPGIFRFFLHEENPVPVPVKDIKRLMAMEDKDGIIKLPTSVKPDPKMLRPGMSARIRGNDAFAGQLCKVAVVHEPSGRCEVVLKIMGRDVRTVLHQSVLSVTP
jgi:transcription antitermination factor NusG